jgi:hypothetical protein
MMDRYIGWHQIRRLRVVVVAVAVQPIVIYNGKMTTVRWAECCTTTTYYVWMLHIDEEEEEFNFTARAVQKQLTFRARLLHRFSFDVSFLSLGCLFFKGRFVHGAEQSKAEARVPLCSTQETLNLTSFVERRRSSCALMLMLRCCCWGERRTKSCFQ